MQLIIQLNEIYTPSWIYADTGAGEFSPSYEELLEFIRLLTGKIGEDFNMLIPR